LALVNLLSLTERQYKVNTLSGLALGQLKRPGRVFPHPAEPNRNPETVWETRIMANRNRTTSTARRATAAKATKATLIAQMEG
jgi:hypothetical protein